MEPNIRSASCRQRIDTGNNAAEEEATHFFTDRDRREPDEEQQPRAPHVNFQKEKKKCLLRKQSESSGLRSKNASFRFFLCTFRRLYSAASRALVAPAFRSSTSK